VCWPPDEGTGKSPVERAKLGWKWYSIITNGLIDDIELFALDRDYDYPVVRTRLASYDLVELEIQERGTKPPPGTPHRLRWIVEALNSWWSNYGHYVARSVMPRGAWTMR